MYSRVFFLLGFIVFELTGSDLPVQQRVLLPFRSSLSSSCLFQFQTVNEHYGVCSAGCKDSCQEVVCCFPRYSQLPVHGQVQAEYSWGDHLSVCLATILLCCRGRALLSCSSDSLTDADFGCMTNCFCFDCSSEQCKVCEIYCPSEKNFSCPADYVYPARSNDCCSPSDDIWCCFQSVTKTNQMQEPIFRKFGLSACTVME